MSNASTEPKPSWVSRIGGRKQLNAWAYAVILTWMAFRLDANFADYALWLAVGLLGTAAANVAQKRMIADDYGSNRRWTRAQLYPDERRGD